MFAEANLTIASAAHWGEQVVLGAGAWCAAQS